MSACEECWTAANLAVMTRGGSTVERYREELAKHEVRLKLLSKAQRPAPRKATAPHPDQGAGPSQPQEAIPHGS